ncbi:hypothetical protein SBOR_8661 [Sclerotinia borealis F-4128]|uniref:Cytosine-specific methyltransferase n=1 Tax=Sclerotinia borealis (strain F-4128) TaxID=1432307 RepID=W9C5E9_SCLBF|nr:hypothetical protein SBOR_8661 [Sclerotinia borealis F-4128]
MATLSGIDFRKKFASLFEIDPLLTNTQAYTLLEDNSFDLPNTCLDVAQAAGKRSRKEEFWVPQKTLDQLSITGRSRSQRTTPSLKPDTPQSGKLEAIDIDRKSVDRGIPEVELPEVKLEETLPTINSDDEADLTIVVDDQRVVVLDGSDEDESVIVLDDNSINQNVSRLKRDFSPFEISDESDTDISSDDPRSATPDRPLDTLEKTKRKSSKQSTEESVTLTTSWISKIAGNLFGRPLRPVGTNDDEPSGELALEKYRAAISSARSTGEKFLHDIDSELCYARIVYRFENEGQWLILDTSNMATISGVGHLEEKYYTSADSYFYRFNYDILSESFTEASEMPIQDQETPRQDYECCARNRAEKTEKDEPFKVMGPKKNHGSATGLIYKGTEYHRRDFVYFVTKDTSGQKVPFNKVPYRIGQIQYIRVTRPHESDDYDTEMEENEDDNSEIKIMVDVYERYDDHFQATRSQEIESNIPFALHDERRVFLRGWKILSPENLDGHCFVMHRDHIKDLDTYKDLDDTFWVQDQIPCNVSKDSVVVEDLIHMPKKQLRYSKESKERLRLEKEMMESKESGVKLRTLDIFSGAGGLSQGFHESGVIGTTYAIEFDAAACKTLKRNFPDAIVYNQDANKLLEWLVKNEVGSNAGILLDREGNDMAVMPTRGEVDMIIGGPPCQGWSTLNRHKRGYCNKRELIATYLSYVDFYRPKYFLLENVMGLVGHKLDSTAIPDMNAEKGLLKGAVKFIFRVLTSLGYQCQHAFLQADVYGLPSSRTRVIFWASLPGHKLPQFPQPTHIFDGRVFKSPHRVRRSAPHQPVTIGDCLSDLPRFEWKNPHIINAETPAQRSAQLKRDKDIVQYTTVDQLEFVGLEKQAYGSPPLSEYQRKIRKSAPGHLLQNHQISLLFKDVERVCNVPLRAGAAYKDMPENLLPLFLQNALQHSGNSGKVKYSGRYGRQSIDQSFKVVTTLLRSLASTSWILHPYLHRTYSAREFARAQRFSDCFTWDIESTKEDDIYTQIGNAVPVPLARALGNELWKFLRDTSGASSEIRHDEDLDNRSVDDGDLDGGAIDDQKDIESKDRAEQESEIGEEVVEIVMRQGGKTKNTGKSRDDAITLDDSD